MGHLSIQNVTELLPGARAEAWASLGVVGWKNLYESERGRVKDCLGEQQETKEFRDMSRQERDHSTVLGAVLESPLLYSCL